MKRFNRLSLGFSKKLENLAPAVALHVAHYNFCRVHGGLEKITRNGCWRHRGIVDD
jgi:hypothetical protein